MADVNNVIVINSQMNKADAQRLLTALQNEVANWDTIKAKQLADIQARIVALQAALV